MAIGSAPFVPEVIIPSQTAAASRKGASRLRILAGAAAACLLVAVVCIVGSTGSITELGSQDQALGIAIPRRYAKLARDHDDRSDLKELFDSDQKKILKEQEIKKTKFHTLKSFEAAKHKLEEAKEERAAEDKAKLLKDVEEEHEEKTAVMVPWVHWPHSGTRYSSPVKQQLLQAPVELAQDEAAEVMPLSEIMDRLVVDRKLHEGHVSDTQLAMADQSKPKPRAHAKNLDCAPFC